MRQPRKLTPGMLLAGVDVTKREYDKAIEWYNKGLTNMEAYHTWDIATNYVRKMGGSLKSRIL